MSKIYSREALAALVAEKRAQGEKVVFTNGCFDILHVGHVQLLERARSLGDFLVVGLNSDASVKRLKGESRPIHPQDARATVLAALQSVDAVVVFEEDTPIETIRALHPSVHVKGGDYKPDELPEASAVLEGGGEVVIIPLVEGFSTTKALEKAHAPQSKPAAPDAIVMVPARYGSTRFPGKPLVNLNGHTVISRVVRAVLESKATLPVVVATDDERIAVEVAMRFTPEEAVAVMTSEACHTGTDRLAEATRARLGEISERQIIVNVQGDEPFIDPAHINTLIDLMAEDESLPMATLATPIRDAAQEVDPNVVKAVVGQEGRALYFSRATVPFDRDRTGVKRYRHLGIYAYDARWLLKMAALSPSPLEEAEKLEQLRALENGAAIGIAVVDNVVPIAIDTPEDLTRAEDYLRSLM